MILRRIERYLKSHRVPPARFGRLAVGDPRFVFDLRDGREPRAATERRVAHFLDQAERAAAWDAERGVLSSGVSRAYRCAACRSGSQEAKCNS
jgi:hypothetical protein